MDIDKKLEEARKNVRGYGEKYGAKETADDYLKTTYAKLYLDVPKSCVTVPEKDAWIKRQVDYMATVQRKRDAYADWKTAKTYMKILLVAAEVWRTQQANDRLMDKAHR